MCKCLTVLHVLGDDVNGLLRNHSEKTHQSRVLQGLHQVRLSQESADGHSTGLEILDSHLTVVVIQPYTNRERESINGLILKGQFTHHEDSVIKCIMSL